MKWNEIFVGIFLSVIALWFIIIEVPNEINKTIQMCNNTDEIVNGIDCNDLHLRLNGTIR